MSEVPSILKALADETRYNTINLLLCHDLCVRALAKRLNLSEPAVSQHLQVLRRAGLVKGEKRGYYTHYSVNREVLAKAAEEMLSMAAQPRVCQGCGRNEAAGTCTPGMMAKCCHEEV